ncbi:MAG: DUF1330 domain-containing protein [Actinomycetia bacterium]|nr:DUF1330 domain-containing protein [Actinomycetes bacterium]
MTGHIEPTEAQLERLMASGIEGPVTMLNLLRYRDVADYSEHAGLAPTEPVSGREAYGLYSAGVLPILAGLGAAPVFFGACNPTVIGPDDEQWDDMALIRYPDLATFAGMVASAEYQAIMGHRTAALADSRLVPTDAVAVPDGSA